MSILPTVPAIIIENAVKDLMDGTVLSEHDSKYCEYMRFNSTCSFFEKEINDYLGKNNRLQAYHYSEENPDGSFSNYIRLIDLNEGE